MRLNIEYSAKRVIAENFITEPPVPINTILGNYGIKSLEVDIDEAIAGLLDPDDKAIFVNKRDSIKKKTFTLAYELGHFLLHAKQVEKDPDIAILYRKPIGSSEYTVVEKEAVTFAVSLLVPEEFLKDVISKHGKVATATVMSDIFGVTEEIVKYRMKELKLTKTE